MNKRVKQPKAKQKQNQVQIRRVELGIGELQQVYGGRSVPATGTKDWN
jgi:hypothetical protein